MRYPKAEEGKYIRQPDINSSETCCNFICISSRVPINVFFGRVNLSFVCAFSHKNWSLIEKDRNFRKSRNNMNQCRIIIRRLLARIILKCNVVTLPSNILQKFPLIWEKYAAHKMVDFLYAILSEATIQNSPFKFRSSFAWRIWSFRYVQFFAMIFYSSLKYFIAWEFWKVTVYLYKKSLYNMIVPYA